MPAILAKLRRVYAWIADSLTAAAVEFYVPDGGTVVVIRLPPGLSDDTAFVKSLRKEHSVQVTAGSFFRMPGHVRIAYMNLDEAVTRAGVNLLIKFIVNHRMH